MTKNWNHKLISKGHEPSFSKNIIWTLNLINEDLNHKLHYQELEPSTFNYQGHKP